MDQRYKEYLKRGDESIQQRTAYRYNTEQLDPEVMDNENANVSS